MIRMIIGFAQDLVGVAEPKERRKKQMRLDRWGSNEGRDLSLL